MTRIWRIFTDLFFIRAHPCHPHNPCSITILLLTDDTWIRLSFPYKNQLYKYGKYIVDQFRSSQVNNINNAEPLDHRFNRLI